MTVSTEWFVAICGIGVLVIGGIGLLLAFYIILSDIRAETRAPGSVDPERIDAIGKIIGTILFLLTAIPERRTRTIHKVSGSSHVLKRILGGTAVAVVLATIKIYADDPNGACTEATLREFWGDNWLIGWYLLGCYLLPG